MSSYKIFQDDSNESNKLCTYVNSANRCFIKVGEIDAQSEFTGFVTLDSDDLTELISELQHIKNLIDKSEENG